MLPKVTTCRPRRAKPAGAGTKTCSDSGIRPTSAARPDVTAERCAGSSLERTIRCGEGGGFRRLFRRASGKSIVAVAAGAEVVRNPRPDGRARRRPGSSTGRSLASVSAACCGSINPAFAIGRILADASEYVHGSYGQDSTSSGATHTGGSASHGDRCSDAADETLRYSQKTRCRLVP